MCDLCHWAVQTKSTGIWRAPFIVNGSGEGEAARAQSPIRVKSQQLEATAERKEVNSVMAVKVLYFYCADEWEDARAHTHTHTHAQTLAGWVLQGRVDGGGLIWSGLSSMHVWPVIRESWGEERALLRTNEDEEEEEGLGVESVYRKQGQLGIPAVSSWTPGWQLLLLWRSGLN